MTGLRIAIAAVLVVALSTGGARAESAEAQVERLANEAVMAYKGADYRRAVELLQRAYDIRQVPALMYNMAKAYDKLGDVDHAYESYRHYVDSAGADAKLKARAEARIAALEEIRRKKAAEAAPPRPVEEPKPAVVAPPPPPGPTIEEARAHAREDFLRRRHRARLSALGVGAATAAFAVVAVALSADALVLQHQFSASNDAAQKGTFKSEATAPGNPLVIVGLYLLSEPTSGPNDHAIRQAVDLAAFELNTLNVPVRDVACDTGGDKDAAVKIFDFAVDEFKPAAVIGPNTSSEMLALAPEAKKRNVVIVSPAATAAAIADLHAPNANLTWRTCGSDNLQAKVLATLVPPTAKPLDVVWVPSDPYADGLAKAFIATSGRSDATPIQFDSGMAAEAVAQMNAPAYAVLVVDYDAPALVAALHGASGQSMTQYLMTDAALTPTLWGAGPYDFSFLTRIRGTAPALPDIKDPSGRVYAAFQVSYRGKFNMEDPADTAFVANAYDAAYAIAIAAAASGAAPTGASIAANLARMSDHAGTSIDVGPGQYQAGVNALVAGGTIDLVGASGPIDWDDNGDVISAPIEVWQVAADAQMMPTFKVLSTVTP